MRKRTFSLLALILVATACSDTTDSDPQTQGDPTVNLDNNQIRLLTGLIPFDGCDDLLSHLQAEARDRVGPYGLDYYGYGYFGRGLVDAAVLEVAEEAATSDFDSAGRDTGGVALSTADAPQASRLEGEGGAGDDFTQAVFDLTRQRRVALETHVTARLVVVGRVAAQGPDEVSFTEGDDVIGAFPSDGSDEPLHVRILPGRSRALFSSWAPVLFTDPLNSAPR